MPELRIYTIDGFAANIADASQITYGFTLEDIDTSIDPSAIPGYVKTYDGTTDINGTAMPAMGSACLDPQFPGLLLTSIAIEGSSYNSLQGRITYSSSTLGFTPTVYLITRTRQFEEDNATILPDGTVLNTTFKDTAAHVVCEDLVPMKFRRSAPVITFEGLRLGSTDDSGADYIGYVNDDTYRGRPAGSWLVDDYTTVYSKYTGYSQFRISVVGRILGRDWSTIGVLFNQQTGRYCKVAPADVTAALAPAYDYGMIYNAAGKGIVRAGGYDMVNFPSIGVPA